MKKVLYVFSVVESGCGGGAFGDFLLVAGLSWVDTCKNSVSPYSSPYVYLRFV